MGLLLTHKFQENGASTYQPVGWEIIYKYAFLKAGSQRGLGLQGSGLKNAGLQGSKAKISGL